MKKYVPNEGSDLFITEDERQLYLEDMEIFKNIFKTVDYKSFQIFSRLDRLICGYPVDRNNKLVSMLNSFDAVLLKRCPFLSKYGRWGVIKLGK